MAPLEIRSTAKLAELETRLTLRIAESTTEMIRWVLAAVVRNAGIMLAIAWVGKHLP